jgi:hypothetical protein
MLFHTLRETVKKLTKIVLDCVKLRHRNVMEDDNQDLVLVLNQMYADFDNVRGEVPEFRVLKSMQHKYDDKTICYALMERISEKTAVMQSKLGKFKNIRKKGIAEKIKNLSENYSDNESKICALEKDFNRIMDAEFRNYVLDNKIFNVVNAEKPTKHFLDIAEASKLSAELECIEKEDGSNFESTKERNDFIYNFYSDLYRNDDLEPNQTIEDFLGPVAEHPVVKNSKLTPQEKNNLDLPYNIIELDKSLKQSNFKSAPGNDGYSNRFINEFWYIFREPLFDCFTQCLDEGALLKTFLRLR